MEGSSLLYGFALQSQKGQALAPCGLAAWPPCKSDGRIAVGVAFDTPLDAQRAGCRRLHYDRSGLCNQSRRLRETIDNRQKDEPQHSEYPHIRHHAPFCLTRRKVIEGPPVLQVRLRAIRPRAEGLRLTPRNLQ